VKIGENYSIARKPRTLEPTHDIIVGTTTLHVAVAKTPEAQTQGLSGIQHLANNEGMLFPFSPATTPEFWMKDMLFPIDIIWIKNNVVVGTSENLLVPKSGMSDAKLIKYSPSLPIDAALEVPAGWVRLNSIYPSSLVKAAEK